MDGLLWAWAYVLAKVVQSDSTVRRLPASWAFASPPLVFYCIFLYLSGFVRCSKRERYKRGVETPLVLSQFSRRRIKPACENWSTAPDTSRLFRPQDAPACICPPWPSGPSGAESSKSLEASKTSPLSLYSNFCTKTAGPTAQNKKRPTFPCGKVGRFYVTLSAACVQTSPAGQSGTTYLYSSTRRVRCS